MPHTEPYDGVTMCAVSSALYSGPTLPEHVADEVTAAAGIARRRCAGCTEPGSDADPLWRMLGPRGGVGFLHEQCGLLLRCTPALPCSAPPHGCGAALGHPHTPTCPPRRAAR